MGLSELKNQIEKKSRHDFEVEKRSFLEEQSSIIREARKKAEEIIKEAKQEASNLSESILSEAKAESESESNAIIAMAVESRISSAIADMQDTAIKALLNKEKEIVKSAIKSFSKIVDIPSSTFESNKDNIELAKGFAKKLVNNKINGVILTSSDGSIVLDATVENILSSNIDKLRGVVQKNILKEQ
ncbi:MAG: hypothetical protein ACP5M9_02985 [Candidatus Micrarchaeia archaeon]